MSWWTSLRDIAEGGAADVANVITGLPVSAVVNPMLSKGAQEIQGSTLGQLGQLGSTIYGASGGTIPGINTPGSFAAGIPNYGQQLAGWLGGSSTDTGAGARAAGGAGGYQPITQDIINASIGGAPSSTGLGVAGGGAAEAGADYGPFTSESARQAAQATIRPATTTAQKGWLDTALSAVREHPWQAASLGLGAMNIFGQRPAQLDPRLTSMSAPMQQLSQQLTQQYQSGTLNPSDQFKIAQWSDANKAAARDYYAKAGLGDSSMAQQALAQIDAQANAMRDQTRQNTLKAGLDAAQISYAPLMAEIQGQVLQDAATQDEWAKLSKNLMMIGQPSAPVKYA